MVEGKKPKVMNQHFTQRALREAALDDEDPLEGRAAEWRGAERGGSAITLPSLPDRTHASSAIHRARSWLRNVLGHKSSDASLKEVLEEVLEDHEEEGGRLPPQEETMLRNILSFGDMTVSDIMIPRADILAVPHNISLADLKAHVLEMRHTRIPVYRGNLDAVEGFLHIKDLLPMIAGDEPFSLEKVMRPMLFVPPSMRIIDLLLKMRRLGSHMAIVVDEYGGTDGLVTLEDLFEEIVGDIQDEHDEETDRELVRVSPVLVEADARIRIEKLEEFLRLNLRPAGVEEFDTLGGLIFSELGHVPVKGEKIAYTTLPGDMLVFEVLEADSRTIKKVRIHLPEH